MSDGSPVSFEGMKIVEPDWKVLFGALAVQVTAAFVAENNPDRAAEHMVKAMKIIERAYDHPCFIKD